MFRYDPAVTAQFPRVVGGVIHATDVRNGPSPSPLVTAFQAGQAAALARIGSTPLSELPSLAAWRRAFREFGVDPTGYRSAAEALLRRLTKQGSIPSINELVDIGNLVSIRYALPVAIFDRRAMTGPVTVRFANGDETFSRHRLGPTRIAGARRGRVRRRERPRLRATLVLAAVCRERIGPGHNGDPGDGRGSARVRPSRRRCGAAGPRGAHHPVRTTGRRRRGNRGRPAADRGTVSAVTLVEGFQP